MPAPSGSPLLTTENLAARLGVAAADVDAWRRRYGWPHVRFGRTIRFTEEDVAVIIARHHVEATPVDPLIVAGQTPLSAARHRTAALRRGAS